MAKRFVEVVLVPVACVQTIWESVRGPVKIKFEIMALVALKFEEVAFAKEATGAKSVSIVPEVEVRVVTPRVSIKPFVAKRFVAKKFVLVELVLVV